MPVYGLRPDDVVTDTAGNVQTGATLTLHATQADAQAAVSPLASVVTSAGRWSADLTQSPVWVRTPNGAVYEIADFAAKADKTYVDTQIGGLGNTYAAQDGRIIANDKRYGTPGTRAALINALDAAEAAGQGTVVFLTGVWDVGNGLSMSGRTSQLRGASTGGSQATPGGTVIHATTQAGPVIDWTGWVRPTPGFAGKVLHGGFLVRGSGIADATKANSGMKLTAMSSVTFADIAIRDTGGPCLDFAESVGNGVYLSDFERIVLMEPISMNANDVPFMQAVEANGNRFRSFGLRSFSNAAAPSGAVRFTANATYAGHDNLFDGWWFEGLLVPNGGTLFEYAGNAAVISDFQFFDCAKTDAGATGTSYIRLAAPAVTNFGANIVRGNIPGKGTNTNSIDTGVDVRQSNNRIEGVKGYKGTNVTIASGVQNTHVNLGGAYSTSTDPAVVDNSGNSTNTVEDNYSKTVTRPATTFKQGTAAYTVDQVTGGAFAGMPRYTDPTTPANGGVLMGNAGARWQAAGAAATGTADSFLFRDIALNSLFSVTKTGIRGVQFFDGGVALPPASVTYRGRVVMVQGAAGVADRLVICRKDAADAYAWVDLF